MICDVPCRNLGSDSRGHMQYGSQLPLGLYREGYDAGTVAMYHRHHLGPRLEHGSMNEPLGIGFAGRASDRFTRVCEFHDIAEFHAIRSARTREKKMVR